MNNSFLTRSPIKLLINVRRRFSVKSSVNSEEKVLSMNEIRALGHPLVMSYDNLALAMGGTGKAKVIWNFLSQGCNPLVESGESDSDTNYLSAKAKRRLLDILDGRPLIPGDIVEETQSECGTKKLLVKQYDGQSIESVLIPSTRYGRTTLCVSTQIGQ